MHSLVVLALLLSVAALVAALVVVKRLQRIIKRRSAEVYVRTMELEQERDDRRKIEGELRLIEQSYRAMFTNARDMVLVYEITDDLIPGMIVEVNDVACEKLGFAREKLLGMTLLSVETVASPTAVLRHSRRHDVDNTVGDLNTLSDGTLLAKEQLFPIRQRIKQLMADKQVAYECIYQTSNGTQLPVEVSVHKFEMDGQVMAMSTAHDIARRKETERALRESERQFHDFFSHSPLGVAMYNAESALIDVNQSFLKMFGIPDRDAFSQFNVFDNPFLSDETKQLVRNGESVRCEMIVDFNEAREKRVFISSRRGIAHFDMLLNNLGLDSDYVQKGHLVQILDITQRRQTETALQQRDQELRQAQKMEAIGTLAGGIAHDFNNILTPILGYAEITLDTLSEHDDVALYMTEILKASNRAKDLVQQILTFSRRTDDDTKRKPVHITPIVKEVLALLRGNVPKNVSIERIIKTEHDVVRCDPTQIHQIIMNLCTNARHAMDPGGGTLEVRMTDFMVEDRAGGEFANLEPGRFLRISVKDEGTGMSDSTLERIFEPFFTTKANGKGTGMGLSVVHGIVTSLGGSIRVETEVGVGSTFHVVLPVESQEAVAADNETETVPTGNECILFVDDEIDIARLATHMLSSLGYDPVICTAAPEALQLVQKNPQQFDLVIADQVMPDMPGTELARQIRAIRPDLPIIICSGFSETISREQAEFMNIQGFLAKPVLRADLACAIRKAIDETKP